MNTNLTEDLYVSIESGNLDEIKKILSERPELLQSTSYGMEGESSLLHYAAGEGQTEICAYLISLGLPVDVIATATACSTPLHEAAGHGHAHAVRFLLEKGAAVDGHPTSITTPLIDAIIDGHTEVCKLLIEHNADVNRVHARLNSAPADIARSWGQLEIEEMLKRQGAMSIMDIIPDAEQQFGGPVINFVHNTAGWVLPAVFSPSSNSDDFQFRISCIDGKNKFKLLFTVGLFQHTPRTELFLCLPGDWPLPRLELPSNSPWAFPVQMLSRLAHRTGNHAPLEEGVVICRADDEFSDLAWPEGIDGLLTVDKPWNKNPAQDAVEEDENVSLYVMFPIKFGKKGIPIGTTLAALVERKRTSSWASSCLSKPSSPI
jgi:hypothetical protein